MDNYYIKSLIYVIFMITLTIGVINSLKNKNILIKNKISLKKLDLLFLLKWSSFSFFIRIILEQIIIKFNLINEVNVFDFNVLSISVLLGVNCFIAPITEEIVIRFGLFEWMNKHRKSILNVLIVSAVFVVVHGYGLYRSLIMFAFSIIWTYSYYEKSNLFYPIIMHFFHNLYSLMSYFSIDNVYYIVFGIMCFISYLLVLIIEKKKQ